MPIRVTCPGCKNVYTVGEDKRGKKVRCRECEKPISVPDAKPKKRDDEEAIQETRKIKAAARKADPNDNDDEDDDRPAKKGKNKKAAAPAKSGGGGMMLAVGGVAAVLLLCLLGVGGVGGYWIFASKGDPAGDNKQIAKADDNKNDAGHGAANPDNKPPAPENPPGPKPNPQNPPVPNPIVDPDAGKPLPAEMAPETVAKVKKATVYLHVTMPSGVTAEGSGFFAMERGIIVTNAHVIGMLMASSKPPTQVDVVQDSGLPTETKMVGDVLGVDRASDLAVIRVPDNGKLPAPLYLASEAPVELQKVYIFGFPFGESLGKNITINEKKINAMRPDTQGNLDRIQIDGGMNPGNSGGPVVNTRGNLIGVSVSIITGAQISFAVPAEKVRQIMEGRIADHQHGDAYAQQGQARMPVRLKTLDPLNKVRDLRVEVWTGPPGNPRPTSLQKPQPMPGDGPRQEHAVSYANGAGTLDVPLPQLPAGHVYWVQPVVTSASGTHWAPAQPTSPDLAVLERKPVNLTIDLDKQKERSTHLEHTLTITEIIGKTQIKESIQTMTETLEVLQDPVIKDGRKTATIRTAYGPVTFNVTVNGKKEKFSKDELDAMAIVRGMPPTFVIDDANATVNFITVSLTPKNPKYYLASLVQALNNMVQNPYEATQFKMPNRVVQPQETFPSQSTMARRSRSQQAPPPGPPPKKGGVVPPKNPPPPKVDVLDLKMNMTYQGVRMRNNREEAILSVTGTLESRVIKGRVLGDITGKIGFDTAGGFISFAKIKIFFEEEETIPGLGTLRISESRDLDLDRAVGNTKNLALRQDPPPPPPNKDPNPGQNPGGATKLVGFMIGDDFRDTAPEGGLLVGLEVGLGLFFKNECPRSIRPIYRVGTTESLGAQHATEAKRVVKLLAKPGYAVGAVNIKAGQFLDGMSITFMKVKDGKLDPGDAYDSEWIGGGNPPPPTRLGGTGAPVVGIIGKTNKTSLLALGLVLQAGKDGPVAGNGPDPMPGGAIANPAPNQFFNGDVALRHFTFAKPGPISSDIVWTRDGKSIFVLQDNGLLQRINVANGHTEQFLDIGGKCTGLAMSGEGLVIAAAGAGQLLVVDPDKLADVKKKIPLAGLSKVSAGKDAALAWAGVPNPSGRGLALKAVDLKTGATLKTHANFEIWHFAASPDGKFVFVANDDGLSRYKADLDNLTREDVSFRIGGNNTRRICLSYDSKFVAMPSGGGNGVNLPNHPPLKNYPTYIYRTGNLKVPAAAYAAGGFPRAVGIDPKNGVILAQNNGKPLIIYSFGADAKLGEYDFKVLKRAAVTEFSISPLGGEAFARTETHDLIHIKINKGGPPVVGFLEPGRLDLRGAASRWIGRPLWPEPI